MTVTFPTPRYVISHQSACQCNDGWSLWTGCSHQASVFLLDVSASDISKRNVNEMLRLTSFFCVPQVNKLKRDLACMKQELLYKEQGFETLKEWVFTAALSPRWRARWQLDLLILGYDSSAPYAAARPPNSTWRWLETDSTFTLGLYSLWYTFAHNL